jgi:hypothetical protein
LPQFSPKTELRPEDIQRLFAPDKPKPGFGKVTTDFLSARKLNLGHGRLEKPTIETNALLNDYVHLPGLGQLYRLERQFAWIRQEGSTKPALKSSTALPAWPDTRLLLQKSFAPGINIC